MNQPKKSLKKIAENQMEWEVVTEGVTAVRLEVHRLHQMVNRGLKVVEVSGKEDECFEAAGDLIVSIPEKIKEIERLLDRTAYALTKMGEENLRNRLPASDRNFVEETSKGISFLDPDQPRVAAQKLATAYLDSRKK